MFTYWPISVVDFLFPASCLHAYVCEVVICSCGYDCKCSCPFVCPVKVRGQFWVPFLRSRVSCVFYFGGGGAFCHLCSCVYLPLSPILRLSSAGDAKARLDDQQEPGIACLHLPKAGAINVLHYTWLFKCRFRRLNSVPRVCMAST